MSRHKLYILYKCTLKLGSITLRKAYC